MIVGCYTLDLYCDNESDAHNFREFPHQFTAERETDCMRQAAAKGWRFKDNKAYCPKCAVTLKMARKRKPQKSDGQTAGWIEVIKGNV